MLLEILLGVFVPIIFSLVHTIISVYLIYTNGNLSALAWNMIGFITKTMFMLFMTYIGVFVLGFDFRIEPGLIMSNRSLIYNPEGFGEIEFNIFGKKLIKKMYKSL